jgi:hypothetical protein
MFARVLEFHDGSSVLSASSIRYSPATQKDSLGVTSLSRSSSASSRRPADISYSFRRPLNVVVHLLQANTGTLITESFAVARIECEWALLCRLGRDISAFGKIDRGQVADYHERKGMSVAEVERWLGPNLNYDPAE